ncbi:DUF4190 domain-containing protein [Actinomycetospora sp. TBRC 11914]|uniref:DUF4190 domain-containing protein n=1 Tax=Actinomycetospora sp. TBRC 11914 TaxID=2729387 RepID=UPI00145DD96C|nr:DUF4190 domain-containing protein [Actinomycetospora sp. TBRC 11914]NMO90306.1 DUF4190 domain-containing protein [Actinomycetospora sp. TBRC 11914]
MTSRHGAPPPATSRLATIAVLLAAAALVLSFFAQPLAVLLLLAALVCGIVVLVRVRRGGPGKGPAVGAIVLSVLALIIAGVTSPAPSPAPVAAPVAPVVDPNVLPADVVVASVQSPDNLVTTAGRRLHVTMMQGHPPADACQTGTNAATATRLVQNQRVHVTAPDTAHSDTPAAVPPGFQPVVLTLPDGSDYSQTWAQSAAENWQSECVTAEPTPTSTSATPTTTAQQDTDVDVDRPYVPAPDTHVNTRVHTGHSGHPCLPGERDGDHDGYCGE